MPHRPTVGQVMQLVYDDIEKALRVIITSGGSGGSSATEYTEGATDTTITGVASLTEGPSNTLTPLQSDASKNLLVSDTTAQATLASILTAVDNLEGFTDGLETLLTALSGFVDGLEGFVDGLEGQLTTLNAKDFATEATLASIDGKLNALGQTTMANSVPVVLASDQSPLDVNILSGGSSGTQYTEGDTDATITGTAALAEGPSNTLTPLQTDASKNLKVAVQGTVTVDGSGVTQPISAASLPLPSGAATAAKQDTGNASLASIDGKITAVNTGAVVVSSSALPTGAATAAKQDTGNTSLASIDGKITAVNTGAVVVSSSALPTGAATEATLSTLNGKVPANLTVTSTRLLVDGSGVTQPVSGTITATIAAGATTIAKAEDVASADADVGVPAMAVRKGTPANTSGTDGDYEMLQMSAGRLWTSSAIDTALPAGTNAIGKLAANSGVTIGAVEIAAAQTLSTVTSLTQMNGQAIAMGTGVRSAGTQRVTVATDDLVPISAASLPLPTGAATLAEQQTQTASLSVLDDWDESDRAKVNTIAGQAGVQGGSGTVSANTQRVVLATDVGLPTGTNNIGSTTVAALSTANSRANSSLGVSAVFTGTFEDATQYSNICIGILDAGAAGGSLVVNWSEDGVNTRDSDAVVVPTANGQQYVFGRKWQYFQVIYAHGAAAGNVVIQTILNKEYVLPSTHFGTDTISTSQDAQLVIAENRLLNGSTFLNQTCDASGNAIVVPTISATQQGTGAVRFTALTNVAQAIKASAGNMFGYHLSNKANPGQDLYVHLYNVAAGSVTVGTTTPSRSYFLPGGAVIDTPLSVPATFGTAMSIAVTTDITGSTAPTNAIYAHVEFI
jgi:hypothetical protein